MHENLIARLLMIAASGNTTAAKLAGLAMENKAFTEAELSAASFLPWDAIIPRLEDQSGRGLLYLRRFVAMAGTGEYSAPILAIAWNARLNNGVLSRYALVRTLTDSREPLADVVADYAYKHGKSAHLSKQAFRPELSDMLSLFRLIGFADSVKSRKNSGMAFSQSAMAFFNSLYQ